MKRKLFIAGIGILSVLTILTAYDIRKRKRGEGGSA